MQQLLAFQLLSLDAIAVKREKLWLKQIGMKCFRCHCVEQTSEALPRKTAEQSVRRAPLVLKSVTSTAVPRIQVDHSMRFMETM